ncbi:hypothetical protein SDJN02_13496, partial [Cucurbita argyrosperma subsp. argyrosperma]
MGFNHLLRTIIKHKLGSSAKDVAAFRTSSERLAQIQLLTQPYGTEASLERDNWTTDSRNGQGNQKYYTLQTDLNYNMLSNNLMNTATQ